MKEKTQVIDTPERLLQKIEEIKAAQSEFSKYSQEQVDAIFKAAAIAANAARIPLAIQAAEETGMGIMEDKVIKNNYASEYIYNKYKATKTCGVIEEDESAGITKIAEPVGIIAAVIPTTNPTSTAIFKCLLALKTRNGILISPHPRAKNCTNEAARIILEAAVKAGAPKNIIGWVDVPSLDMTNTAMQNANLILATGGPGMVKAAYSSGRPAIGVGAGNVPAIVDSSADVKMAASSIVLSKTFDNGMICASEQAVIALPEVADELKAEFIKLGCYFLNEKEIEAVRKTIIINGSLNAKIVGQSAFDIAALAGIKVDPDTKILIGEVVKYDVSEEFAHEKLSPVLAFYRAKTFDKAVEIARQLVLDGGHGHTSSIFIDDISQKEKLDKFIEAMESCRIVVNSPSSHGGIGDLFNFALEPSLTLGCGSYGGNSVSENVGVKHLLNIKTVAKRRENMLWFRTPPKVYHKKGCLPLALEELKTVYDNKRVFIVTDGFLYNNGYTKTLTDKLDSLGIKHTTFYDVQPDPTLASAHAGAAAMRAFEPDSIIAIGGGSPIDAAKIMWVLYEHPDVDFADMAMTFMDIRKRVYTFPRMGIKSNFIAIPTTAGTGSEVTPFAVITDEKTNLKYPIADYELMPTMAIIDVDLMMNMPKSLTAASGIDAMTHSIEAFGSMLASPYTDSLAIESLKLIFKYLPRCYNDGASDVEAREAMANAATMAGMAFANAFLGICHSLAHKLGAFHHLPHGIANALLIEEVMKFNMTENPKKIGAFSQYKYPNIKERYATIAKALELTGKNDDELVSKLFGEIKKLKKALDIKETIAEYGIAKKDFEETLDEMTLQAFNDQCTGANPRYPLVSELREIYTKVYGGK